MKKSYLLLFAAFFAWLTPESARASLEATFIGGDENEGFSVLVVTPSSEDEQFLDLLKPTRDFNENDGTFSYTEFLKGVVKDGMGKHFVVKYTFPEVISYTQTTRQEESDPIDGISRVETVTSWKRPKSDPIVERTLDYERKIENFYEDPIEETICVGTGHIFSQGEFKPRHFWKTFDDVIYGGTREYRRLPEGEFTFHSQQLIENMKISNQTNFNDRDICVDTDQPNCYKHHTVDGPKSHKRWVDPSNPGEAIGKTIGGFLGGFGINF